MHSFGSDNHSPVHPLILQALIEANQGQAASYGTDDQTKTALRIFEQHFGTPLDVFWVFNGTGANVLALAGLVRSYESVLCAECAHINVDECGAPEAMGRFKLIPIAAADGKLRPELIEPHLIRRGDQHFSQPRAISITQPTELGTLYTVDEIREITRFAREHGLWVHLDGARLILAAERLQCSFDELTRGSGIDVVSFGGTKNGLLFGEAVLVFHPALKEPYKYLRKQLMQLPSKTRFIAAQFAALLGSDLWQEISRPSCEQARLLADGLSAYPEIRLTQNVQVNAVFACLPKALISKLRRRFFFYVWNEQTYECRLMTGFDTKPSDVDEFLKFYAQLRT